MRKRSTIDPDTELVAAAADVLGTRRTIDTVHAAFWKVVAIRRRLRLLDFRPELSLSDVAASRQGRFVERRAGDRHRGASMHRADTSVLINAAQAGPSRDRLRDTAAEARVALCDMVVTDYLRGARDTAEYQAFGHSLRAYAWLRITGQELLRLGRAGTAT